MKYIRNYKNQQEYYNDNTRTETSCKIVYLINSDKSTLTYFKYEGGFVDGGEI